MIEGPWKLVPFQGDHAAVVARWVASHDELFWVAPMTSPPLTADKVRAWTQGVERGFVYVNGAGQPTAYGELNPMPHTSGGLWIGHLVVAPQARGCSVGRSFLRALLEEAFERQQAETVGLVVFPGNRAAIQCYRGAGIKDAGAQYRRFPGSWRKHELRYMRITRAEYQHSRKPFRPHTSTPAAEPVYA